MAFKLIESAQARWRDGQRTHLVALGRAGATFDRLFGCHRGGCTQLAAGVGDA